MTPTQVAIAFQSADAAIAALAHAKTLLQACPCPNRARKLLSTSQLLTRRLSMLASVPDEDHNSENPENDALRHIVDNPFDDSYPTDDPDLKAGWFE